MREPAKFSEARLAERFASFDDCGDPQLAVMKREAMRFCRDMASADVAPRWIALLGTSGAGKTMLARVVTRFFRDRMEDVLLDEHLSGPSRRYLRRGGLLRWEERVRAMVEERDFGFMRQACEDWFLALDDIGAEHERLKELSTSKLFAILCAREKRWTVITANLSAQQIADRLDTRIASRLFRDGGVVIDVDVPDYNLRRLAA